MNDEKLIELVRQYPPLYDQSNLKYMDTEFKMTLWRKIGGEMKTTGSSCKTRWANIRDNFRKSIKKNMALSALKGKIIKPYKYSEQLQFILRFFEDMDTVSSMDAIDDVRSQDYSGYDYVYESLSSENEGKIKQETTETIMTLESQGGTLSDLKQTASPACPTPRKNRKQSASNADPLVTDAATVMEYPHSSENYSQHPVDAFLSGVAPSLKKLPPRYWHYAKADIFAAVQKYELQMIIDEEQVTEPYPVQCSTSMLFEAPSPKGSYHSTSTRSSPPVPSPKSENFCRPPDDCEGD